jgi:signal transduction histidine kinase
VQEALTNVAKYAQATEILVRVVARDDKVEVMVRDNGVGFDAATPRLATHGLLGMKFRVESENGVMRIESAPGRGTSIVAVLPCAAATARETAAGRADAVSA